MKLVFIRHGDPDYEHDSLTERGKKEAELLGKFLKKEKFPMDAVFCSPLGRALLTCKIAQSYAGFEFETLPWLREFRGKIDKPDRPVPDLCWDLPPKYFSEHPGLRQPQKWLEDPLIQAHNVPEEYEWVSKGLDEVLSRFGYERDGYLYRVKEANEKTLVFFCHFGVTSVMMGHLSGFSPYVFFQHFCARTTSITTFASEERQKGIASFRCFAFGETQHLKDGGMEPSFAARFQETFLKKEEWDF